MSVRVQRAAIACLAIVCGGLVAAVGVNPDVRFESKTELKLGGTLGTAAKFLGFTKPEKTTTQLKGDVMRIDEGETSEIIDLEREVFIKLDRDEKRYSVQTFEEWRRQWAEDFEELEDEVGVEDEEELGEGDSSNVVAKFDSSIEETGETKKIEGYECREVVVKLTFEGQDTVTGETNTIITTSNIWLADDLPGFQEVQDFYRRLDEKLGRPWKVSMQSMTELLMQENPEAAESFKELAEESQALEGTPLLTVILIETMSMGGEDDEEEEGGGDLVGKVGGLFGKKDDKGGPEKLLESKTTVTRYSTDPLSDDLFKVPEDYEEVDEI
ncbi:MAG: hypothetical protein AMS21_12895 [Gemmatimonas sp. SG8_38_2]|nr:MAG: hypothetical protein AMS21_12895 [Gemmatimonas sp. SG8_38_2]